MYASQGLQDSLLLKHGSEDRSKVGIFEFICSNFLRCFIVFFFEDFFYLFTFEGKPNLKFKCINRLFYEVILKYNKLF